MAYKKRILQAVAFCFILAIIGAFTYELYFVDDWVGGVLVWNSEEAYLFSGWSGMGYHSTAAGALLSLIPAYFGVSRPPDDTHGFTLVFRITPTSIEKYVVPGITFRSYIPKEHTIYAWDGGPLWKWAGNHFDPATPDEEQKVIEIPKVTILSAGKDFSDLQGWSVRNSMTGWLARSEIELSGKPIYFFMKLQDLNREVSLDVQLPTGARERILHAKSRLHLVSKSEYKSRFQKNQKVDSH